MANLNPHIPSTVALPSVAVVPGRVVRRALGIRNRSTLLSWVARAGFPAAFHPDGNSNAPHHFTKEVAQWLQDRGVTVEWTDQ